QHHGGIGGDRQVDSLKTLIVSSPTAHQKIAHGDMTDLRLRTDSSLKHAGSFIDTAQSAKKIQDVQRQNDIGVGQYVTGSLSGVEAMGIGKIKATTAVDHGHGYQLSQAPEALDGRRMPPQQVHDGHGMLGLYQQVSRALQRLWVSLRRGWRRIAVRVREYRWDTYDIFLQAGVVAYIDRSL